jgi:hypothetical protein
MHYEVPQEQATLNVRRDYYRKRKLAELHPLSVPKAI